MGDLRPVKRAILSVSDKSGLVEFARGLSELGIEIVSTGGTAKSLRDAGLKVISVESVTGFPEMMDGRIKTLHPSVHGAILARRDHSGDVLATKEHTITPIDLVCINLYPFEETARKADATREEIIENIDIGGPAMIRAAAKNHEYVAVVVEPEQYEIVLTELRRNGGATTLGLRERLGAEAFARTASYDAAIARTLGGDGEFPKRLTLAVEKTVDLRYGENPHQRAALYRDIIGKGLSIPAAERLHGSELSYNNILDATAAMRLARDLARLESRRPGAVVVKHTNPCGAAVAGSLPDAVELSLLGDPLAAYGGILAVNQTMDRAAASIAAREGQFLEVIIAPGFDDDALALLKDRWKNVRLLATGELSMGAVSSWSVRSVPGGALVQEQDELVADAGAWTHAAGPKPTESQLDAAGIVWTIAKHLTSNAIAIGGIDEGGVRLFGAGAGQMDRVASCEIAVKKAGARAGGSVAASDAFFPFPDGPKVLIDAGVRLIAHPGGSKRDRETFDLCEARGVTCMTTGHRHFRH